MATSHNNIPHVTPVNFIFIAGTFYFAVDYDTKKYRNIQENKNIALAVDAYSSSMENKAVVIQGIAEIVERGKEFKDLYDIFYRRFEWVRDDPWNEGEAPIVKVRPLSKTSWGLG